MKCLFCRWQLGGGENGDWGVAVKNVLLSVGKVKEEGGGKR